VPAPLSAVCVSSKVSRRLCRGAFASTDIHTLVNGLAEEAIPRTSHHYLYLPGRSIEGKGEGGSKSTVVRSFRRCSLERTVSALAITPLLRRRSSGRVSGRCGLCRHLRRRPAGDPHAGGSPEHQAAPTTPQCGPGLALAGLGACRAREPGV
jgi:hypothetical protein